MPRTDAILDLLLRRHIPMTRENNLHLAYLGNPPEELSAEEEYSLPEQFQKNPPTNYDND
jgi:hypothetical protein